LRVAFQDLWSSVNFDWCLSGLAEKMLATKEGGYEALIAAAEVGQDHVQVREAAIVALASLLDGNPDPLDESGFKMISETLAASTDASNVTIASATLNLTLNCCVRHEQNRQNLVSHIYLT
jgi:metal-dependent amidase/aminoacylase/carboxypeptidase family protein